jgi:uncharacterized protein (TIGR04255 family)
MKKIRYCKDARITEVWCAITAAPGPIREEEAGYILQMAGQAHKDLVPMPVTRVIPRKSKPDLTPPYWTHEVRWNEGRNVARFGHRILGLHRVYDPDLGNAKKYSTYDKEVVPDLMEWLDLFKAAQADAGLPIASLQFGYANRFPVNLDEKPDLEKMFHIRYGLKTLDSMGLGGVDLTFHLGRDDTKTKIIFKSTPTFPSGPKIAFIVKISALRNYSGIGLGMSKKIISEIDSLHSVAKDSFFEFITSELRDSMGAEFDE